MCNHCAPWSPFCLVDSSHVGTLAEKLVITLGYHPFLGRDVILDFFFIMIDDALMTILVCDQFYPIYVTDWLYTYCFIVHTFKE